MGNHRSDYGLSHSLRTIRAANMRLVLLTSTRSTQAVLVSQIELCNLLLGEIRAISCSLEKGMDSCGMVRRRAVVARRVRGGRHFLSRNSLINCSKR